MVYTNSDNSKKLRFLHYCLQKCVFFFYLGTSTVLLTRVNCADWSDLCVKQNVTEFPVLKMYKKGKNPVSYAGMLGTEDLLKFIQL